MAREIPLTRGLVAIVDDDDFERFGHLKWHATIAGPYACRNVRLADGSRFQERLHRLILDAPPHMFVDHANRDSLDNRRVNLRLATPRDNIRNGPLRRNNSTGYRGVSVQCGLYRAVIRDGSRQVSLGLAKTAIEAALRYDEAARRLHGEFASLNFPEAA